MNYSILFLLSVFSMFSFSSEVPSQKNKSSHNDLAEQRVSNNNNNKSTHKQGSVDTSFIDARIFMSLASLVAWGLG